MPLSKEDAEKQWCPFSRYAANRDGAANRFNETQEYNWRYCTCITEKCMAWEPVGNRMGYCSLMGRS